MKPKSSTEDVYLNSEWQRLKYKIGISGEKMSEAINGAVPRTNINPQKCPFGLYAEQLSGTSFTTPRVSNQRIWFYKILPSVRHGPLKKSDGRLLVSNFTNGEIIPNQTRWNPLPLPKDCESVDFIEGLITFAGNNEPGSECGLAIHLYSCNSSMVKKAFCNSDGDFVILPQIGTLQIITECGRMTVEGGQMCLIPRGFKFSVNVNQSSRGYVAEVWGSHPVLPDLGPIGANGLANPRDFKSPLAWFSNVEESWLITQKFCGNLFNFKVEHCPFDVVGWFGNYYPYKYDFADFVAVNSVTVDHMDPSIFTVLTSQTNTPGVALLDVVIFPPRWSVHTNTFRPPYYHRNCMSEFMGNLRGQYEAKENGFLPGGSSLHSPMIAHGPDEFCFEKASAEKLVPISPKKETLAFMFESCLTLKLTKFSRQNLIQKEYLSCWQGLKKHFKDPRY